MTEDQQQQKLSALLRLKRFEQPPPGYFEKLVQDVHRRQRADLLRRPLWKIAIERVQTFFGEHSMGRLQYGGAMAAVLVTGVTIFGLSYPTKPGSAPASTMALAAVADFEAPAQAPSSVVDLRSDDNTRPHLLSLQEAQEPGIGVANPNLDEPVLNARLLPERTTPTTVVTHRYIIDNRPASYDAA